MHASIAERILANDHVRFQLAKADYLSFLSQPRYAMRNMSGAGFIYAILSV